MPLTRKLSFFFLSSVTASRCIFIIKRSWMLGSHLSATGESKAKFCFGRSRGTVVRPQGHSATCRHTIISIIPLRHWHSSLAVKSPSLSCPIKWTGGRCRFIFIKINFGLLFVIWTRQSTCDGLRGTRLGVRVVSRLF